MFPSLNLGLVTIYLYPFFWGLAWASGFIFVDQKMPSHLRRRNFFYFLFIFFSSFLGAKFLFFASDFSTFFSPSAPTNFASGLGFVFYGGLIAGAISVLLISFFDRQWFQAVRKYLIIILPLAHGLGRLGCFFAGCCFGVPWDQACCAINNELITRVPIPIIEAFFLGLIFLRLNCFKNKSFYFILGQYLICYGILRMCLEVLRDDYRGLWLFLPPSVWISLILIYLGIFFNSCRCKK